MKLEEQIEEIMDNFDFAKVRIVMNAINWTYISEDEAPDVERLMKTARRLLTDVVTRESRAIETGGFRAEKINGEECEYLKLSFIVEHSSGM